MSENIALNYERLTSIQQLQLVYMLLAGAAVVAVQNEEDCESS